MKHLTLALDGVTYAFMFPNVVPVEVFNTMVGNVRVGPTRNWERSWRKATLVENNIVSALMLNQKCKYICFKDGDVEMIVVFPHTIDHDRMFESLQMTSFDVDRKSREWYDIDLLSAGFVYSSGKCYGRSETLDIDSRGDVDTLILKGQ